jgi:pilus assembly protein CpaE
VADFDLEALLICPARGLADEFLRTIPAVRAFQILADLKSYPEEQALEMRLRQLEPHVVLLDLSTNPERAGELIDYVLRTRPNTPVIGLHTDNDPDVILRSLRRGACEFLFPPFDPAIQNEAANRVRRLRKPVEREERARGKLACFASAKPGAGASRLAWEAAMELERRGAGRILLIDGDVEGGTLAEAAGVAPESRENLSLAAVLNGEAGQSWQRRTPRIEGAASLELLPAPLRAPGECPNLMRLSEAFESARQSFDWVIVDLPAIFDRMSLLAIAESDAYFLVTSSDLAGLHHARRALTLLAGSGISRSATRVVVNGAGKRDGLSTADLVKVLSGPVEASVPKESPGAKDNDFGKAIQTLVNRMQAIAAETAERQFAPAA